MKWELINPSDKIFFDAPDLKVATVACTIVGRGQYGADSQESEETVSIFLPGEHDEWCKSQFNQSLKELFDSIDMDEVRKCLKSFRYDLERTSLNRIVDYAHKMAENIKEKP